MRLDPLDGKAWSETKEQYIKDNFLANYKFKIFINILKDIKKHYETETMSYKKIEYI